MGVLALLKNRIVEEFSHPRLRMSGISIPSLGQRASAQTVDVQLRNGGVSTSNDVLPGFSPAAGGSYETYRKISAHPTVTVAMAYVRNLVVGNPWVWKKRDESVPEEWLKLIRETFNRRRQKYKAMIFRSLEMGWTPFEQAWEKNRDGYYIPLLRPLLWDCTEILGDGENVVGLKNHPEGGKKVELLAPYYFRYTYDEQPGNPYGRSRHENIRQTWSEGEQIRQKIAQYVKKISGVIMQMHYPLGTTKDATGAPRANQWIAQQMLNAAAQGQSMAFPNLFMPILKEGSSVEFDWAKMAALADKTPWRLSAFDPGGTDHSQGFVAACKQYDVWLARGWHVPERAILEALHGSRADSAQHSESGVDDAESVDLDIADAVSSGPVNDTLEINFGKDARDSVFCAPPEISDSTQKIRADIAKTIITATKSSGTIDLPKLYEAIGIPTTGIAEVQNEGETVVDPDEEEKPEPKPLPAKKSMSLYGDNALVRRLEDELRNAGWNDAEIEKKVSHLR